MRFEASDDGDMDDIRVEVACPQCGERHVGNADQVLQWRTEHKCDPARQSVMKGWFSSRPPRVR